MASDCARLSVSALNSSRSFSKAEKSNLKNGIVIISVFFLSLTNIFVCIFSVFHSLVSWCHLVYLYVRHRVICNFPVINLLVFTYPKSKNISKVWHLVNPLSCSHTPSGTLTLGWEFNLLGLVIYLERSAVKRYQVCSPCRRGLTTWGILVLLWNSSKALSVSRSPRSRSSFSAAGIGWSSTELSLQTYLKVSISAKDFNYITLHQGYPRLHHDYYCHDEN